MTFHNLRLQETHTINDPLGGFKCLDTHARFRARVDQRLQLLRVAGRNISTNFSPSSSRGSAVGRRANISQVRQSEASLVILRRSGALAEKLGSRCQRTGWGAWPSSPAISLLCGVVLKDLRQVLSDWCLRQLAEAGLSSDSVLWKHALPGGAAFTAHRLLRPKVALALRRAAEEKHFFVESARDLRDSEALASAVTEVASALQDGGMFLLASQICFVVFFRCRLRKVFGSLLWTGLRPRLGGPRSAGMDPGWYVLTGFSLARQWVAEAPAFSCSGGCVNPDARSQRACLPLSLEGSRGHEPALPEGGGA